MSDLKFIGLIYLLGVMSNLIFVISIFIFERFLRFLTNYHFLDFNLVKLGLIYDSIEGKHVRVKTNITTPIMLIIISSLLSWIMLTFNLVISMKAVIGKTLLYFEKEPEELLKLRYILKHNLNMSKESVWAHLASIQCILKIESETYEVIASLEEFEKNVNGFDKEEAIKIFNMIGVKRIETEIFVKKSA